MTALLVRAERWVWYLFLGTAAWQTRIIFWQADTAFVEWRSAALYLSDVLMCALFVGWACAVRYRRPLRTPDWLLGLLCVSAILSLSSAEHLTVGIYGVVRLVQYCALFIYIRSYARTRFNADRSAVAFVVGALGQALLGIAQYVAQHDIGLRWIGETLLRTDMRGVAVFYDLTHEKVLRAYGTLPHPNVLAVYLMVALWVIVWLWIRHSTASGRTAVLWQVSVGILLIGMYLTYSRTVLAVWIVAWVALIAVVWWKRVSGDWPNIVELRRRLVPLLLTVAVVSIGFCALQWPRVIARLTISVSDEAVQQRVRYTTDALATGGSWGINVNWTGIGMGNFTSWLARYDRSLPSFVTQPAHNIYVLAYSEIGVLGLALWLFWLVTVYSSARTAYRDQPFVRFSWIALVCAFVLIGVLDHFFWTLQQGRILWWAVLALAVHET